MALWMRVPSLFRDVSCRLLPRAETARAHPSLLLTFAGAGLPARAAEPAEIRIGYLHLVESKQQPISLIDEPNDDDGIAGARLGIDDNNGTGRFTNQHFSIEDLRVKPTDDAAAAAKSLIDKGIMLIVVDLPPAMVLAAADAARPAGATLFDAGSIDDSLREENCRANVIHTAPTRSMLADALAQYLSWKRWQRWLLVTGSHPQDALYADALKRAAKRFGDDDRRGARLQGHGRREAHRHRHRPDAKANPGLHPECACL